MSRTTNPSFEVLPDLAMRSTSKFFHKRFVVDIAGRQLDMVGTLPGKADTLLDMLGTRDKLGSHCDNRTDRCMDRCCKPVHTD